MTPSPRPLPYGHQLYFVLEAGTRLMPLAQLQPTKPAGSQPDSELRAAQRMAAAARGEIARRPPLTVRQAGRLWKVLDGNATLAVARLSGWPDIPVTIEHR